MQIQLLEMPAPAPAFVPILAEQISREIETAYADCMVEEDTGKAFRKAMNTRQLQFIASAPMNRDQAAQIMTKVLRNTGGSYNAFTPNLLLKFPADCKIWIAREGSVCLYVEPGKATMPTKAALEADEYDEDKACWWQKDKPFATPRTRIWWD